MPLHWVHLLLIEIHIIFHFILINIFLFHIDFNFNFNCYSFTILNLARCYFINLIITAHNCNNYSLSEGEQQQKILKFALDSENTLKFKNFVRFIFRGQDELKYCEDALQKRSKFIFRSILSTMLLTSTSPSS